MVYDDPDDTKPEPSAAQRQLTQKLSAEGNPLPGVDTENKTRAAAKPETDAQLTRIIKLNSLPAAQRQAVQELQKAFAKNVSDEATKQALAEEIKNNVYGPVSASLYDKTLKEAGEKATVALHKFARAGITNIPPGCPLEFPPHLNREQLLEAMKKAKVELPNKGPLPSKAELDNLFNANYWTNYKALPVLNKPAEKAQANLIDQAVAKADQPGWKYKADSNKPGQSRNNWEAAVAPLINTHIQASATMESLKLLSQHLYDAKDRPWVQQAINDFKSQNIGTIEYDSAGNIADFKINLPKTLHFDHDAVEQINKVEKWNLAYSTKAMIEMAPIVKALNSNRVALWNDIVKDRFDNLPPLTPHGNPYNLIYNRFNVSRVPDNDQDIAHRGMIRVDSVTTYHNANLANPYNIGAKEVDRETAKPDYYQDNDLVPIISGSNLYLAQAGKLAAWQNSEARSNLANRLTAPAIDLALVAMGGVGLGTAIKAQGKALTTYAAKAAVKQAFKSTAEIVLGASGALLSNASVQQEWLGRMASYGREAAFVYGATGHMAKDGYELGRRAGSWLAGTKYAAKDSEQAVKGLANLIKVPAEVTFAAATPYFLCTMGQERLHKTLSAIGQAAGGDFTKSLESMGLLSKDSGPIDTAEATAILRHFMEKTGAEHFLKTAGNILTEGKDSQTQALVRDTLQIASLSQSQSKLANIFNNSKSEITKTAAAIGLLQLAPEQATGKNQGAANKVSPAYSPTYKEVQEYLLAKLKNDQSDQSTGSANVATNNPEIRFAAANALFQKGILSNQEFAWECDKAFNAANSSKELQMQSLLGTAVCTWASENAAGQGSTQEQYEYASRSYDVHKEDLEAHLAAVASGQKTNDIDLRAFAASMLHAINRPDHLERATLLHDSVQRWQDNHDQQGQKPGGFAQSYIGKLQSDLNYNPEDVSLAELQAGRIKQFAAAATLLSLKGDAPNLTVNDTTVRAEEINEALAACVTPSLSAIAPQAVSLLIKSGNGAIPKEQEETVLRNCVSMLYRTNNQNNLDNKMAMAALMPELAKGASPEAVSSMVQALSSIIDSNRANINYAAQLPELRQQALKALGAINSPQASESVQSFLANAILDPSVEVRASALEALKHHKPQNMQGFLSNYISQEMDLGLRQLATNLLNQEKLHTDPVASNSASLLTFAGMSPLASLGAVLSSSADLSNPEMFSSNEMSLASSSNGEAYGRMAALHTEFSNRRTNEWLKMNFPDLLHENYLAKVQATLPPYMQYNAQAGRLQSSSTSLAADVEHMLDDHKTFDYANPFTTAEDRIANKVRNLSIEYGENIDVLTRWAKGEFTEQEVSVSADVLPATQADACAAVAMLISKDCRNDNGLPLLRESDHSKISVKLAKELASMCRTGGRTGLDGRKQAGNYVISLLQNNNVNPEAKCALLAALPNLYDPPEYALLSKAEAANLLSSALVEHRKALVLPEEIPTPLKANYAQQWHYDKAYQEWENNKKYSRAFQVIASQQLVNVHMDRQALPLLQELAQNSKDPYLQKHFQACVSQLHSGVEIAYRERLAAGKPETSAPPEIRAKNIEDAIAQANMKPGDLASTRQAIDVIFQNIVGMTLNDSETNAALVNALYKGLYSDNERVRLASAYALTTANNPACIRAGIDRINEIAAFGLDATVRQDAAIRLKQINSTINKNINDTELRLQNLKEARAIVAKAAQDPGRLNDREQAILKRYQNSRRSFDELERKQKQLLNNWTAFREVFAQSGAETNERHAHR